jgi:spermidine/putrescine transport system substrate-binding protein
MSSELINPTPEQMKNLVFLAPLSGAKYKLFNDIWNLALK